jgi:MYXO-CTERM domain-containing protein
LISRFHTSNNSYQQQPMKTLLSVLSLSLFLGVAAQAQVSFTWSGTYTYDDNGSPTPPTPFEITFTTADPLIDDPSYAYNFLTSTYFEAGTEDLDDSVLIQNITGDLLGGSWSLPSTTFDDPYDYFYNLEASGDTFVYQYAGQDDSDDIGLTFDGVTVEDLYLEGVIPLPWVDPTGLNRWSDFFTPGTYAVTDGVGTIWLDGSPDIDLVADSLTISVIPEPAHFTGIAGLLGLGLVLFLRRRKQAVQQ